MNADVPGGFNEGSGFTQIMAELFVGIEAAPDVATAYVDAVMEKCGDSPTVAMVHATAYMDDREVMEYLGKKIVASGGRALPCAPEHVRRSNGCYKAETRAFNDRVDAVIRFFPADWLTSCGQEERWRHYFGGTELPVSNPATSILIQSKRFPLVWEWLGTDLSTWRKLLPETIGVDDLGEGRHSWVLKPALGRVGEGVGITGISEEKELQQIRRAAKNSPDSWIAQRRFNAIGVEHDRKSLYATLGVYTVDGSAAGIYARVCDKALIDHEAQDVAVLLVEEAA